MYQQGNPYQYGSNFGNSFLQENMQQMVGNQSSGLSGQFNNVMSSLQSGITNNVQQGGSAFGGNQPLNPQAARAQRLGLPTLGGMTATQIAAQMNTGGAMSVLPMLGNSMVPQIIFPLAGVYSLVDGIRSLKAMSNDARAQASGARFDPAELSYNKTMAQIESSSQWNVMY